VSDINKLKNLPCEHISVSQLNTYSTCSEKYRLQYVEKAEKTNSTKMENLICGNAFHKYIKDYFHNKSDFDILGDHLIVEYFYNELLKELCYGNRFEVMDEFKKNDLFRYYYEDCKIENNYDFDKINEYLKRIILPEVYEVLISGYFEELKKGKVLRPSIFDILKNLCAYFRENKESFIKDIVIENQEFKTDIIFDRYGKEFKINIILDFIGTNQQNKIIIIDWKTSKRAWSENDVLKKQDHIYSYAIRKARGVIPVFKYIVFSYSATTGNVKHQEFEIQHDEESLKAVEKSVHDICRGINERVFYKNEDCWLCSSDFCEYYNACQKYRQGIVVRVLTKESIENAS
jgi:hypothetical protein